jgi:hypothetical protein
VDATSGVAACGTIDSLQLFSEERWGPVGEWCTECEELVPFD